MKQILNDKNTNNYASQDIIGKYIYFKEERKDSNLYYILTVKSIEVDPINSEDITYFTNKCYLLFVSKNKECRTHIYDNYDKVNISPKFDLYEMSFSEYVNTFREFIKNDGKFPEELPSKIIQDEIY